MKHLFHSLLITTVLFASCNSSTPKSESTQTAAVTSDTTASAADSALATYQCPMKCQGDTTYSVAGQCPVCEMDLEKL